MIIQRNFKEIKSGNILLTVFLATIFIFFQQCQTTESERKTVVEESQSVSGSKSSNPFEKLPQGFLNSNTFQVVVSSLKTDQSQAESEAKIVAGKKSFQMLQTYTKKPLGSAGRTELKEISESGKITKSGTVGDKKYFVYQITRSGLKILVESKLP